MTVTTAGAVPAPATSQRDGRARARGAGVLYLVTFASSIPALALERPALAGPDSHLLLGGVLDLINAAASVGTAITLYPLLRQRHPSLALGFVTSRLAEAAMILASVAAILSLVTLRTAAAGAAGARQTSLVSAGTALIALHTWTSLLGPGLIPAVSALLLGTALYRAGLVPRVIPAIGLIGAPILLASATATIFGVFSQVSALAALAALPVGAWELSLGVWLTLRGMRPDAGRLPRSSS